MSLHELLLSTQAVRDKAPLLGGNGHHCLLACSCLRPLLYSPLYTSLPSFAFGLLGLRTVTSFLRLTDRRRRPRDLVVCGKTTFGQCDRRRGHGYDGWKGRSSSNGTESKCFPFRLASAGDSDRQRQGGGTVT